MTLANHCNPATTITVSKFFTDRHAGVATDRTGSSEDSSSKKQRSLFQRLHIHTSSIKRGKSPTPLRPSTASEALGKGSPIVHAVRKSPSTSDAANIEEIIRIMPQSLIIGAQGAKRQRSADGRPPEAEIDTTQNESKGKAMSGVSLSRSSVRIPPYLEKSRGGRFF